MTSTSPFMSSISTPPAVPSPILNWSQQTGTGIFRPPPPFTLGEAAAAEKHRSHRSDKHKTDLCRNWEQTGTCSFPNCTFAHGLEELRPAQKSVPPPVNVTEYVDELSNMLRSEVKREADFLRSTQAANRRLEDALSNERAARQEDLKAIDALEKVAGTLAWRLAERDRTITSLRAELQAQQHGARQLKSDASPINSAELSPFLSNSNGGSGQDSSAMQQDQVESILSTLNLVTPTKEGQQVPQFT